MNITVIEGATLNHDDLNWGIIEKYGRLKVYDRTPAGLIEERCADADIILSNKVPFTRQTLERLPKLKMINVMATGYNIIDTEAAKEKRIVVCNIPGYGTASVAQHSFALLLELTNHTGIHAQSVAQGGWQKSPDWCYTIKPITELQGKILGIVGLGNIGMRVAAIAKAFGMKIICCSNTKKETDLAMFTDINTLFARSDFISLHCPLQPGNFQFINKALLQKMKASAMLINTARGQLIHEQDLADALNNDLIAGAALDVLSTEPPLNDNPLLNAKNCIITPHNAWISKEARQRILNISAQNIEAFIMNKPVNRVG
ncbi:MAG TPA: D-2-hydroxyacid dehydrogenase [Panacibacter sp.]|nr:D-2-hydroxyacid dehydrogenase [Panacibacter sp.]